MKQKNKERTGKSDKKRKPLGGLIARILVGAVFVVSGLEKLASPPQEFAAVIEAYRIMTPSQVGFFAIAIPWLELILGLFLLTGHLTKIASVGTGTLILSFMWILLYSFKRGISLDNCGCFGSLVHLSPQMALMFDSLLLCLTYIAFRHGNLLYSLDNWVETNDFKRQIVR